jgi:hypothetical protein
MKPIVASIELAPRSEPGSGPSRGPACRKEVLPPEVPPGRTDPPPSAQAKARAITLRTEVACHCPPRGALIPRAFRASAICHSDVAPLR